MIESITPHTRYTPHTEYWVTWTQHKTWPQTQRLLPPPLTHHASCVFGWVSFSCLFVSPDKLAVAGCILSITVIMHHLINDTTQSASLWSLHHLICIIVIIHHLISIIVISSSSHHFYCDHFIISIFVIIASSHQHHCDHASPASLFAGCMAMVTACVLATVMTNDGGLAMLWRWSLSLSSDGVSGETGTRQTVSRRISSHGGYPY